MQDSNATLNTKVRLVNFDKAKAPNITAAVAPLFEQHFEGFPQDKRELATATLLRMWQGGDAALVVQVADEQVAGVAVLMTAATLLHDCDALVLHFQPAPGGAKQLIEFLPHVASARGAAGIALNLPSNPLGFEYIEDLAAAGWKAKSTVYGRGL